VQYGETIEQAATRGLLEQAGLVGKPKLAHIFHSLVTSEDKQVIEDFVLFTYIFENPTGEIKSCDIGDFVWVKQSELIKFTKKPIFRNKEMMEKIIEFNGTVGLSEFKGSNKYY